MAGTTFLSVFPYFRTIIFSIHGKMYVLYYEYMRSGYKIKYINNWSDSLVLQREITLTISKLILYSVYIPLGCWDYRTKKQLCEQKENVTLPLHRLLFCKPPRTPEAVARGRRRRFSWFSQREVGVKCQSEVPSWKGWGGSRQGSHHNPLSIIIRLGNPSCLSGDDGPVAVGLTPS